MTNKSINNVEIENLIDDLKKYAEKTGRGLRDKQALYMQRWFDASLSSLNRYVAGETSAGAGIVLAEAETGLGKTVGYALPLMAISSVTGKRCAIATHSHLLQKQMMDGDLAIINSWLEGCGRKPLKIARRVGKQAFVSMSACETMIDDLSATETVNHDAIDFLNHLAAWAAQSNLGNNSGLIDDALVDLCLDNTEGLPFGISKQSIALNGFSPDEDRYAYDLHLNEAADADIVLLTHHYLAAIALFKGGRNDFSSLVIDEADRLSSAVASLLHFDLSLRRFGRALKSLGLKDLSEKNDRLIEATQMVFTEDQAIPMILVEDSARSEVIRCAKELYEELSKIVTGKKRQKGHLRDGNIDELKNITKMLKKFCDIGENGDKWNFWVSALSFSPTKKLPSIALMPRNPGWLMSKLWTWTDKETGEESGLSSVLLTSATMGIPGFSGDIRKSFKPFVTEFGLDSALVRQLPMYELWGQYEPARFGGMRFVLPDPSIPAPFIKTKSTGDIDDDTDDKGYMLNDMWLNYVSKMILEAAKNPKKRTLVLTRSYADNEAISKIISEELGDRLIVQNRNSGTKPAMNAFRQKDGAVWLSPTAWEGVDLPGLIKNLVIPRLPVPPDDVLARALLKGYSMYDDKSIDSIMFARKKLMSKRLFRQALGRPIRQHDDKCTVWIGDSRFPVPKQNQNLIDRLRDGYELKSSVTTLNHFVEVIPRRFQDHYRKTLKNDGAPQVFFVNEVK